jgi:hypothetical protein
VSLTLPRTGALLQQRREIGGEAEPPAAAFPVTAGLVVWISADDPALGYANNDLVATWPSRVGSMVFSQPSVGPRPTFIENVVGGLPAIRFNGDRLDTETSVLSALTVWTLHAVIVRRGDPSSSQTWISKSTSLGIPAQHWFAIRAPSTTSTLLRTYWSSSTAFAFAAATTALATNVPIRVAATLNAAGRGEIFVNGLFNAGTNGPLHDPASKSAAPVTLGMVGNGTDPANGDVLEASIHDRVLEVAELAAIDAYLVAKYAL